MDLTLLDLVFGLFLVHGKDDGLVRHPVLGVDQFKQVDSRSAVLHPIFDPFHVRDDDDLLLEELEGKEVVLQNDLHHLGTLHLHNLYPLGLKTRDIC